MKEITLALTAMILLTQEVHSTESCDDDNGSTQKYICESNMSYSKSANELNNHYEELLSIFEREIKAENYNANFKEMKSSLISSQAAWNGYIDKQCLYQNSIDSMTSGAPALEYICKEEFIKERTKFLLGEIEQWKDGSLK